MEITIKYSCHTCGLRAVELAVPAREDENVVAWLEKTVGQSVKADHLSRSPLCTATSVQDLMIPVSGADKIGGPTVQ